MGELGQAFWGAAFAFAFMWLWDLMVRFRDRWARHYTTLVLLERSLHDQMSAMNQAEFEIAGIKEAYTEAQKRELLPFFGNCPEEIPLTADVTDLANMDLLNDYASHRYRVLVANRDIRRYVELLRALQAALADGTCPRAEFMTHVGSLVTLLDRLARHIGTARGKTVTLAAKVRVRTRRDRLPFHRVMMKLRRTRYENDFDRAVSSERAVLLQEIEAVSAQSQRDIDEAQASPGT